jgi:DNA-binding MarR family transcriptional regulator
MTSGIRELFPFGDLDRSVVAAMAERFPAVPVDAATAALRLGQVVVDLLEEVPRPLVETGLSPARWRLLVALVAQAGPDGARMGELAEHLGVREPTVTATVDRAVAEGLVTRSRDETDRRIVRVTITPAGLELVARLVPIVAQRFTALVRALGGVEETTRIAGALGEAVRAMAHADEMEESRP